MILNYTLQFTELINYKLLKLLKLNYKIIKLLNYKNGIWMKKVAKLENYHSCNTFGTITPSVIELYLNILLTIL